MARVLVVDDAAFMRKMVSDALAKGGHEVVGEAGNGVEAVARFQELQARPHDPRHHDAREGRPGRPRGDHRRRPAARVVMCSALGQESKVLEAIKAGAKDFVVKPFQPDRVHRGRRQGARLAPASAPLTQKAQPPCLC